MADIKNVDEWFDDKFGDSYTEEPVADTPDTNKNACDAEWETVPGYAEKASNIWGCVKYAVLFGGLTLLLYYWQQSGLMDASVAVPSMLVCSALAGWGVGKNSKRGE